MNNKSLEYNDTGFTFSYNLGTSSCPNKVKFSADSEGNWLSVPNGEAPSSPVTVSGSVNTSASPRSGTVKVSYDGQECLAHTINVTQSGNTTNLCDSLTSTPGTTGLSFSATEYTYNFSVSSGNITSISVTKTSGTINPTSTGSTTGTSGVLKFEFPQNDDTANKKDYKGKYTVTITSSTAPSASCTGDVIFEQAAKPADLCGGLSVDKGITALTSNATEYSIKFTPSNGDITSISLSNTGGTITPKSGSGSGCTGSVCSYKFVFDANESTTNEKTYNANYSVTITSSTTSSTCTGTVEFKQAKAVVTCDCKITTLTTDPTWLFNETGTTNSKNIFSIPTDSACGTVTPTVTISGDFASGQTGGYIYVYPTSENTSTTSDKTGTTTLSITCSAGGGSDNKTINLTQSKVGCDCSSGGVTGKTNIDANGGTNIMIADISAGDCLVPIIADVTSGGDWLINPTVMPSGIGLTANISANTETTSRTAELTLTFFSGLTIPCEPIPLTVTQNGTDCTCDDFSLGGNPSDWEYNDTSSKDVTVTSSSCISNITVTSSTHFSASVGSGKITITPKGENDSDDPYEETITVSYEANGSSCPVVKPINVKQNTQNCVPTSCTCYIVGNATAATTASSSDTSAEVVWPYTAVTVSKSNTCKTTSAVTETSTSSTIVTFPTNDTCGEETRSGTFTWGDHKACGESACSDSDVTVEWEVKQAKGKPDSECTECTCDNITISNTDVTIGSKANDTTSVAYTPGECSGTWSATTTSDWLEVTSVGSGNINLKALSTNTSSTRTATVTVTLNGSACGGKTITVTQNVQNCDCSDFTITELPNRTINATGGTISAFTVTQTGTCKPIGNTTVTVDNSKFTTGITGDYITISANANDSYENVNGTVTVQVNGESTCTSSTTVTLKGKDCDCGAITSFSITAATIDSASQNTWTPIGTYTFDGACSDNVKVKSSDNWLSVSANSGTIYAKWSAATSYTATRSATITAQWDTTDCGSKTATVTQDSLTCTCDNVTANTVTTLFPQTGGTITVWKVLYDCGSVEPMSASCDSRITSVSTASTEGGVEIKATADANSTIGDVTCEIGYIFKPNASSSCTSNSTVVTLPGIGCGCDNLSIDKSSVTITAGTSDTVTITPGCTSLGTVSVADSTIAEATRSDNTITITGKKQGSTTVTLNYTAGSNTCTKTINVTVNCPTYTINPSGGSGSGGTVTFSVS